MTRREPHETHVMSEWATDIVTLTSTPRFGSVRECLACEGQEVRTSGGQAIEQELLRPCALATKPPTAA